MKGKIVITFFLVVKIRIDSLVWNIEVTKMCGRHCAFLLAKCRITRGLINPREVSTVSRINCRNLNKKIPFLRRSKNHSMEEINHYIGLTSLYYCFSNTHPLPDQITILARFNFHDQMISLSFDDGLVVSRKGDLMIGGVKIASEQFDPKVKYKSSFLPGFRLKRKTDEDNYPRAKIRRLSMNPDSVREGEAFTIMLDKAYIKSKTPMFQTQVSRTLKRTYDLITPEDKMDSVEREAKRHHEEEKCDQ